MKTSQSIVEVMVPYRSNAPNSMVSHLKVYYSPQFRATEEIWEQILTQVKENKILDYFFLFQGYPEIKVARLYFLFFCFDVPSGLFIIYISINILRDSFSISD